MARPLLVALALLLLALLLGAAATDYEQYYYRDPFGAVKGPLPLAKLRQALDAGSLSAKLPVRRGEAGEFGALGEALAAAGGAEGAPPGDEWYYQDPMDGSASGPVTSAQLRAAVAAGSFSEALPVRRSKDGGAWAALKAALGGEKTCTGATCAAPPPQDKGSAASAPKPVVAKPMPGAPPAADTANCAEFAPLAVEEGQTPDTAPRTVGAISSDEFLAHVKTLQPLLVTGAAAAWPATRSWHDAGYLEHAAGGAVMDGVEMQRAGKSGNETVAQPPMTLAQYCGSTAPAGVHEARLAWVGGRMPKELQADIVEPEWTRRLDPLSMRITHGDRLRGSLRKAVYEQLVCSVSGRVRVLMYAPSEVHLVGTDPLQEMHGYALFDPLAPDETADDAPHWKKAARIVATVEKGDCLYIPANFLRQVQQPSGCVGINAQLNFHARFPWVSLVYRVVNHHILFTNRTTFRDLLAPKYPEATKAVQEGVYITKTAQPSARLKEMAGMLNSLEKKAEENQAGAEGHEYLLWRIFYVLDRDGDGGVSLNELREADEEDLAEVDTSVGVWPSSSWRWHRWRTVDKALLGGLARRWAQELRLLGVDPASKRALADATQFAQMILTEWAISSEISGAWRKPGGLPVRMRADDLPRFAGERAFAKHVAAMSTPGGREAFRKAGGAREEIQFALLSPQHYAWALQFGVVDWKELAQLQTKRGLERLIAFFPKCNFNLGAASKGSCAERVQQVYLALAAAVHD